MHDPHGSTTTIATTATVRDYSTALAEAVAHILRTNQQSATICVPDFLQAGHPWSLYGSRGAQEWAAVRDPSDDPERGPDAAMRLEFPGGNLEVVAELMLLHDQAHPFVVDWTRREATALLAA